MSSSVFIQNSDMCIQVGSISVGLLPTEDLCNEINEIQKKKRNMQTVSELCPASPKTRRETLYAERTVYPVEGVLNLAL
jgi:hypothetical protein